MKLRLVQARDVVCALPGARSEFRWTERIGGCTRSASLTSVLSDKDHEDPNFACVMETRSALGETEPAARVFALGLKCDQPLPVSRR